MGFFGNIKWDLWDFIGFYGISWDCIGLYGIYGIICGNKLLSGGRIQIIVSNNLWIHGTLLFYRNIQGNNPSKRGMQITIRNHGNSSLQRELGFDQLQGGLHQQEVVFERHKSNKNRYFIERHQNSKPLGIKLWEGKDLRIFTKNDGDENCKLVI